MSRTSDTSKLRMIKSTEAFLQEDKRPKKRTLQLAYYEKVALFSGFEPIHVLDMPSANVQLSMEMMNDSGISFDSYTAVEYDPAVAKRITREVNHLAQDRGIRRVSTQTGDVLEVLDSRCCTKNNNAPIGFFNLDFCGAMGKSWRSFMLPHLLDKNGSDKFALALTFCPRSPSRPVKKADHALRVIAPEFYGLDLVYLEQNNYSDTSAMCSWLVFYKKRK